MIRVRLVVMVTVPVSSRGYVCRRVGDPADQMRQARRLPYVSRDRSTLSETSFVTLT